MPRLPLECIAKVIEWIDNPQDLFNLLTVSKDVFLIATRCLYRDPFKRYTHSDSEQLYNLVLFLLSLSPASSHNIKIIRQSNDMPLSGTPLDPKPMFDYLSLVKSIRWKIRPTCYDHLCYMLGYPDNMYRQLTWAFVGHRLDEIEELEIEVEDQERYLNNAAKMTRLRKIWIYRDKGTSYKDMYDFAEAMIKAIQLHHEPGRLNECHMIPSPIEWSQYTYQNSPSSPEIDISISNAQRVLSLLPPPRHSLTLPRPDGSTVLLNNPFDPFVSTIEFMSTARYLSWEVLLKLYPGQSLGQILQRFRGMRTLEIDSMTANGDDENILAWAACEAENYHRPSIDHHLRSLVRLESLTIRYDDVGILPTGMTIPKWKILQDGLLGFSDTLRRLLLTYSKSDGRMVVLLFTISRPLPKLTWLSLRGLTIDRSAWELAPNIETIIVDISFPPSRDNTTDPNYPQDDLNSGTSTFSSTSVDTQQQQLTDIWFHCPRLTELTVRERAVCLIDPDCFHLSPHLRKLSMFCSQRSINGLNSHQAPKTSRMIHPTHWTWDWSLPLLSHVTLHGDLHEFGFNMAILRSCPSLRVIDLTHDCVNSRFPLRVKGIINAPQDNNNEVIPFTHSHLRNINFYGTWDIEVDELECLLQVLPGLLKLDFGTSKFSEGSEAGEMVEITKTHPSLMYVITYWNLGTEPPQTKGLPEITSDQLVEMSSIVSKGMADEIDAMLPVERRWIMYTFTNFGSYALFL